MRQRTSFESYEPEAMLLLAYQLCPRCEADAAEVEVREDETKFICLAGHGFTIYTDGKDAT